MTTAAQEILEKLSRPGTKLGELRTLAKEIKTDHDLAMELWASGTHLPQQLAVLIMDKHQLTQEVIDQLTGDMEQYKGYERAQLADWFMANQLMKDRKLVALMEGWQHSKSPIQRRLFWYHQARLRWTGQTPPDNTVGLMTALESSLETEVPDVQWAMNFTAAQIGIHDAAFRNRCIALGRKVGLYKQEKVPRGCTPNYLPEFIRIEAEKLKK